MKQQINILSQKTLKPTTKEWEVEKNRKRIGKEVSSFKKID